MGLRRACRLNWSATFLEKVNVGLLKVRGILPRSPAYRFFTTLTQTKLKTFKLTEKNRNRFKSLIGHISETLKVFKHGKKS